VPTSNGPICAGNTLDLAAGTTADSYSWTGPNSFTSNLQNPSIPAATSAAAGQYTVTAISASGCSSAVATINVVSDDTLITTQPQGQQALVGDSVALSVVPGPNAISFQWLFNGQPLAGETDETLSFASVTLADSGLYSCVVSGATCSDTTVAVFLEVDAPASLANARALTQLVLFPNPTQGSVTVQASEPVQVKVLDALGRTVLQVNDLQTEHLFSVQHLATGLYKVLCTTRQGHQSTINLVRQ
jgi:hypothetical protein